VLDAQGGERVLAGRVVHLSGRTDRPIGNEWVTLHRVAPDGGAPVDSVRSGPTGQFRFAFRPSGDSSAVYFASVKFGGIAYFTPPARATSTSMGGEITVYDTTSGLVPLTIASRHVIVAAPDTGNGRDVLEMFVVTNSGDRTLITGLARRSTFEVSLPAGALDPKVADGDVAAEAMTFAGGIMRVSAPVAPGTKRIAFSYRLPATAEPIALAPAGAAELVEVLVEDPVAEVTGSGLKEEAPTSVDGRTFRRFTGANFAGGTGIRIVAPSGTSRVSTVALLVGATAIAMASALVVAMRRAPAFTPLGGR
jgi:hypothetical protein